MWDRNAVCGMRRIRTHMVCVTCGMVCGMLIGAGFVMNVLCGMCVGCECAVWDS